MKAYITILIFLISSQIVFSQQKIPDWFVKNMEQSIGSWITDNETYKSKNEPFDQYGMDWEWGIGKQSITGKLYGLINGKKQGTFWEFRQYWDFFKSQGIVAQYGSDGTVGIGPMTQKEGNQTEMIQEFISPNGSKNVHRHLSSLKEGELITTSFDIQSDKTWKKRRSYIWYITKNIKNMDLGIFSISLAVKDIKASKSFYEKLGFTMIDGNLDQKWAILKNGNSKIGLFQEMFPSNTLTFNSENARGIHKKIKGEGITVTVSNGMDKKEGPVSFMITDPDGNPILIDQH
ncbi:VOC family protein [Aquimarina macrocephali]|uniref:VOC family protein n=1 Tax=Aquimarina macrocephali TaxID=666563 RepID=UPI0004B6D5F5|nr:VOC family protein [Aquimarina macrocephali]